MSFLTLNTHQIALVALLPKRGAGATAQALATASTLPFARVVVELEELVHAGVLAFDDVTGEYRNAGEPHE